MITEIFSHHSRAIPSRNVPSGWLKRRSRGPLYHRQSSASLDRAVNARHRSRPRSRRAVRARTAEASNHQPQDRQGARSHDPAWPARYCRSGRRMTGIGTPRRFTAVPNFRSDRSEADMARASRTCRSDDGHPRRQYWRLGFSQRNRGRAATPKRGSASNYGPRFQPPRFTGRRPRRARKGWQSPARQS
jgi:hypothetical protein